MNAMKKKIRDISVNGTNYRWSVVELSWPEHELKIWIDGDKKQPWHVMQIDNHQRITPSFVAKLISDVNSQNS